MTLYRQLVDSLSNTDANLFNKALNLEIDSVEKAMVVYRLLAAAKKEPYYPSLAANRMHYLESLRFLYYIKSANADKTDVTTYHHNFRIASIDSFLTFISTTGLEIIDPDEEPGQDTVKYSMKVLRKQLMERKGHAFEAITQLSYIYSQPYPQYNTTDFTVITDGMTGIYVTIAGNYRLSFQFDENDMPYKLTRIESYHIDDL